MKHIILLWSLFAFVIFSVSACHALVVADKLYYQGSIGKDKTPSISVVDSVRTVIQNNHD